MEEGFSTIGNLYMCGLTVLISRRCRPDILIKATRLIRHRGPDDEGFLLANQQCAKRFAGSESNPENLSRSPQIEHIDNTGFQLGLGHRRLAIIDTSTAGWQPMPDPSRRVWIVFNGEIYNYRELISSLKKNYTFQTQTDTEVLLAAYLAWGEEMLHRLNGMFALAIYDHHKNSVFFARDRFGIKPLYLWRSGSGDWMAGSEIKQFTVHPEWQPSLNGQLAYDFLSRGISDHTSGTLFDHVCQLRPGQMCMVGIRDLLNLKSVKELPVQQWYTPVPQQNERSLISAKNHFKTLFEDAVRLRLRADVPVGSCLSGGLDSSSIVCMVSELLQGDGVQKTFTSCSREKYFDERHWAEEVTRHAMTDAHYVYPEFDDLFQLVPRITWYQDEPFGSTSIYAQWHVFALAAEKNITVMLDGQGADEQLAGYHGFLKTYLAELALQGRLLDWLKEANAIRQLHGYGWGHSLATTLITSSPGSLRQCILHLLKRYTPRWLNMQCLGCLSRDPLEIGGARTGSVQALSLAQITKTNLQMLLHWEDRNSMAHGIEARLPFLDYRLVEFNLGLPPEYKIYNGMTKFILREAMHGVLPDKISRRVDKLGFVTPEEIWMKKHQQLFRSKIETAVEQSHGVFNSGAISLFDDIVAGKQPFSFLPWRIINFGEWMELFDIHTCL